ncbi:MAG: T9SS type A sorting domain-containing protein, partial [Bacteroidetes bacterium]|nr:T9SS type A sorting domain-containing protein [Bacteroidota bacterium]
VLCYLSSYVTNAQWIATNGIPNGTIITSITSDSWPIYVGTLGGGIYVSYDNGANWSSFSNTPTFNIYDSVARDSQICLSNGSDVIYSNNYGNTWQYFSTGCIGSTINTVEFSDSLFFAGDGCGIYESTNNGSTWSNILFTNEIYDLCKSGNNMVAAGHDGFYKRSLVGGSWQNTGYSSAHTTCLAMGTKLYGGTCNNGLVSSVNNGTSWTPTSLTACSGGGFFDRGGLAAKGNNVFSGQYSSSNVNFSSNGGSSWTNLTGLSGSVEALGISGQYILAVTTSNGVWRRFVSQLPTSIETHEINMVFNISPNPTSDDFTIEFAKTIGKGTLLILNTIGEKVFEAIISNESNKEINLENISSGIYFVKVFDGEKSYCKKIIVE